MRPASYSIRGQRCWIASKSCRYTSEHVVQLKLLCHMQSTTVKVLQLQDSNTALVELDALFDDTPASSVWFKLELAKLDQHPMVLSSGHKLSAKSHSADTVLSDFWLTATREFSADDNIHPSSTSATQQSHSNDTLSAANPAVCCCASK